MTHIILLKIFFFSWFLIFLVLLFLWLKDKRKVKILIKRKGG